ncbi:MAG TPA: addiction module protein [Thermoanaerobaculia bacterium]
MSRKQKELEMKAMKLDWESRAKLTERLLLSLERESEAEIERLWMEEAQRRLAEIRDGRVLPVPAHRFFEGCGGSSPESALVRRTGGLGRHRSNRLAER